jgi:hypothetical protein
MVPSIGASAKQEAAVPQLVTPAEVQLKIDNLNKLLLEIGSDQFLVRSAQLNIMCRPKAHAIDFDYS